MDEMLDVEAVATLLSVSVGTVRRLIRDGVLRSARVGRQHRVRVDWVEEMLNTNERSNRNEQ